MGALFPPLQSMLLGVEHNRRYSIIAIESLNPSSRNLNGSPMSSIRGLALPSGICSLSEFGPYLFVHFPPPLLLRLQAHLPFSEHANVYAFGQLGMNALPGNCLLLF